MSQRLRIAPSLALVAAMALAAPALARDLIVIEGPVTAKKVDCNGCVKRKALKNNSVSGDKIKNNSVTGDKIKNGAVGTAEIQDSAVTGDKIADGTITLDKLDLDADDNEIAPFRESIGIPNRECNGGPLVIQIDNTGSDEFVVTGIMIGTSGFEIDQPPNLRIDSVRINGFLFNTRTDNLLGPTGGQGQVLQESVDLMGTPLRFFVFGGEGVRQGGNFPHQIVASALSDGPDIEVRLFCDFDSDFADFAIAAVAVSGWKYTDDTVTLDYFLDE